MKRKLMTGLAAVASLGMILVGCSSDGSSQSAAETEDAQETQTDDAEAEADESAAGSAEDITVAFMGFSASNSYALATYDGVEQAAAEMGVTAEFVDGQFDGQAQVQQINDAITTGRYDVIIIQANDNLAVQEPLQRAVDAGITVVIEFTAVGPDFETIEPQVEGAISVVDPIIGNGTALGEMALLACEEVDGECKVAYMEGDHTLPLDNARTNAVKEVLASNSAITFLPTVEGGYSQDQGRSAYQDITQANPDVDVIIGSSQAIAGAYLAAGADSGIKFIANGAPQSAVQAVLDGDWFSLYALDVVANGRTALELGVRHALGEEVEMAVDERTLAPNNAMGTRDALVESGFESGYDE